MAAGACRELRPDVVLADLGLTEPLPGQLPGPAVVGLYDPGDECIVARAMRAGVRGCVDTRADGPELAGAITAAARGQAILSAPALAQLQRGLRGDAGEPRLTERERQVRG